MAKDEEKKMVGINEVNNGFSMLVEGIKNEVRDFIKEEYGPLERKIITTVDGKKRMTKGFVHKEFDTVLKLVSNNIPVFLSGPAGCGKNYICKQIADSLGLKFYFSNAITQEYKLTGFTDANGKYQETQFYKAFTTGGLFMLDEVDASIPEVLLILNAAIANGYFDFPAPIGYVKAHPNFRIVAAGNTSGHGATYEYTGRCRLDGSSLDRFSFVHIDYDMKIEDSLAAGNDQISKFCREFRNVADRVGVDIIVSYRAIEMLAKTMPIMDLDEALKICLVKDLTKDDLGLIIGELSTSKFKPALERVYSGM